MEKILLPILALAILASCSKNENGPDTQGDRVAILLGAGVETSTKAPIVQDNDVEAGIAGWETSAAANYATTPTWSDGQIKTKAHGTTAQSVTWENNTQKYYNADAATKTYMKAWYPRGTVDVSVSASPKVTFTNTDGSVDALLAPAISGAKDDAANKSLAFVHKTTQVSFQVKAGAGLAPGTKIKKITVKQVQLPTGFDLTKDATTADAVTWASAADLEIPNLTEAEITSSAATVGDPVMFKPWADNSLTLDIETDKATYTAKTFTTSDNKLSEGSAYVVTLTFGQSGLELSATIADWVAATGEGEIK